MRDSHIRLLSRVHRMLFRVTGGRIGRRLVKNDMLLRDGGVAAIIGPTGVGKTTTIAKMASRYAMQHGTDGIALISADAHRIGAEEHLATFAKILGINVYPAEDNIVLEQLIDQLPHFRLRLFIEAFKGVVED